MIKWTFIFFNDLGLYCGVVIMVDHGGDDLNIKGCRSVIKIKAVHLGQGAYFSRAIAAASIG